MRLLLLPFFALFFLGNAFAQNNGKISGKIQDLDQKPLPKATVSIVNSQDSAVLSYTLSDEEGKFQFSRIPMKRKLTLFISHINTDTYKEDFEIESAETKDFGVIKMKSGITLDEVVITAQPPVRMNNDTLEYNADYFKTRPNANVEDLLRELPGLQVNMDGTIYYQGKEVSQVKVDGKDFFSSDVRIATRNLDASQIKTVQVFRDRGESKKNIDDEENLPVTINLKFKNEFLSAEFGKIYGSGGSRDRYEAGGLFNTFRDTLQVSFLAYGNNINRESFDYNELNQHAGLGRAENYGFEDFGGRNYWGIGNDIAGGVNFNNDWGRDPKAKNTKLNIMYMYRYKKRWSDSESNSIFRLNNQQQYSESSGSSSDRNNGHQINVLLRHRFDSTAFFEFRPKVRLSHQQGLNEGWSNSRTDVEDLTDASFKNSSSTKQTEYSHSFRIEKELNKAHVVALTNNLNQNEVITDNINESDLMMFQAEEQNNYIWDNNLRTRKTDRNYLTTSYYNKMIEKLTFDFFLTWTKGKEAPLESFYYDRNHSGIIAGEQFNNSFSFAYQDYIAGIKFSWKPIKDLNVNFGTAFQAKNIDFDFISIGENRRQTAQAWLPNFNVRYKSFNMGWSRDLTNPYTHVIQTQIHDLNPLYTRLPSLEADPVRTEEAFIQFNKYTQKYQAGARLSLNHRDRSVAYRNWRDLETGHSTSQSYQAAGQKNFSGSAHFRYNFKTGEDWQYYISLTPSFFVYENYNSINDIENVTTQFSQYFRQEFNIRWKNIIGIAPKYSLNISSNKNSVKDNSDFLETNYLTHEYSMGLNIMSLKNFSLEATYTLQNRASGINTRANYNIINSSLYYALKNKSQIKLSAFDLLNQNTQNYWNVNATSTYYTDQLTLRQYFLLGYIYKFNKTKMKE